MVQMLRRVIALLCFAASIAGAETLRIHYLLDLTRPADHHFYVTITADGVQSPALNFQMPAWYPGRYSIYNYAVNVQQFSATCHSTPLVVTRLDQQTWNVATAHCDQVVARYIVFGDNLSGSFSQLDSTHANVNGGPVLMYIENHKPDPVALDVKAPAGWKVLSALGALNQTHIEAPNYDILIDAPIEAGPNFTLDTFQEAGVTYRVMIHSYAPEGGNHKGLLELLPRLVRTENVVFGGPPPDVKTYTFFFTFDPQVPSGDGMEHLYGTQIIITEPLGLETGLTEAKEIAAHEFFHQWNVKRLRPRALGPFDYTRPNPTRCLWIAEGLTQYYGEYNLLRAGLVDRDHFLRTLAMTISYFERSPGRRVMPADVSSQTAWFHDATPLRQQTDRSETTISYYVKGEILGVLLDLDIRRRTGGAKSLDDVMRWMWQNFYLGTRNSYYLPGHGYSQNDFERALEAVVGASYADFFRDYVSGTIEIPYNEFLSPAGLELECLPAANPYLGLSLNGNVVAGVDPEGPGAIAGFGIGDQIQYVNGQAVRREQTMETLDNIGAGRPATIIVSRHGEDVRLNFTADPPARTQCSLKNVSNASPQERQLREGWLKQVP
jgi:predicted metalloprotease with PDZ domain